MHCPWLLLASQKQCPLITLKLGIHSLQTDRLSPSDSVDKDSASRQAMKQRRKLGYSTQVNLRNIRIAVMGQDGVGKTGKVNTSGLFVN